MYFYQMNKDLELSKNYQYYYYFYYYYFSYARNSNMLEIKSMPAATIIIIKYMHASSRGAGG